MNRYLIGLMIGLCGFGFGRGGGMEAEFFLFLFFFGSYSVRFWISLCIPLLLLPWKTWVAVGVVGVVGTGGRYVR